jgi:hypothetical protein
MFESCRHLGHPGFMTQGATATETPCELVCWYADPGGDRNHETGFPKSSYCRWPTLDREPAGGCTILIPRIASKHKRVIKVNFK